MLDSILSFLTSVVIYSQGFLMKIPLIKFFSFSSIAVLVQYFKALLTFISAPALTMSFLSSSSLSVSYLLSSESEEDFEISTRLALENFNSNLLLLDRIIFQMSLSLRIDLIMLTMSSSFSSFNSAFLQRNYFQNSLTLLFAPMSLKHMHFKAY